MEKRRYLRFGTAHLQVDVSDGRGFFSGSIHNLSKFGLCMMDLPGKIDEKVNRLTVVVSGKGQNFKMLARPRWTELSRHKKNIGVEILNAPYGWLDYVRTMEPAADDPWAEVKLD